jgi:NitT/TauT family transport system substrate-binding protein
MTNSEDKIAEVIKRFPFIKEKLIERNRIFNNLNNQIIFNTVGKYARISDIANVSGEKLEILLSFINGLILEKGAKNGQD